MPTFLFTDIENSTQLWEKHGEAMAAALRRHDDILGDVVPRFGGAVVKHTGDGVFAVFEGDRGPAGALEAQRLLEEEDWGPGGELRVRMGLHAGAAEVRGGDYFGAAVNRAARLCEAAWGGQILFTASAAAGAKFPPGATMTALGVHLLKDLEEPEDIYQLSHPDLPVREFPPIRSLSARPHNLPSQTTTFIGRARELAEIAALLRDPDTRLLTLHGPGGIGKTRLALQAAAEVADDFDWGVYFAALAPVSSPAYLVGAVAKALRFAFHSPHDPKGQLLDYLGDKEVLLVMDNFEHLREGRMLLAEIVEASPAVKVVTTSRERLGLRAERVYEVGGMDYPLTAAVDGLESFDAVRLFVESARRARPTLAFTERDRDHVRRVCEIVGGAPLALELAASWARMLSLADIVAELEESGDLLATEAPDVPERHRSLRAVFDYSYGLLPEEEKSALVGLSVFRGPFTRGAARAVAAARLPALASLADKSLLRVTVGGKYRLHELLRQYAGEKLKGDGYEETVKRFSGYYAAFLAEREDTLASEGQKEALAEIATEIDNVRTAWDYMAARRDAEAIGRSAGALFSFYVMQSLYEEGERAFASAAEALAPAGAGPAEADRQGRLALAKVLTRQARYLIQLARLAEATPLLRKSVGILKRLGERRELALALRAVGAAAFYGKEYERGIKITKAAWGVSTAIDDQPGIGSALLNLGVLFFSQEKLKEARDLGRKALAIFGARGDFYRTTGILNNLGNVELERGHYAEARELYGESLVQARALGHKTFIARSLNNLGRLDMVLGEYATAREFLEESLQIEMEQNIRWEMSSTYFNLAYTVTRLGDAVRGKKLSADGLATARELNLRDRMALCLWSKGEAHLALGEYEEAASSFREGLEVGKEAGGSYNAGINLLGISRWLLKTGRPRRAAEILAVLLRTPPGETVRTLATQAYEEFKREVEPSILAAAFEPEEIEEWEALAERLARDGLPEA